MWIWLLPIVLSYAVFMFVGEHINPFKAFREATAKRRIESGRRAGLIALPLFFVLLFGGQALLKHLGVSSQDDFIVERLPAIEDEADDANSDTSVVELTQDEVESKTAINEGDESEKTANAPVVVKPAFSSASVSNTSDSSLWIKSQDSRTYTIQLNASNDRASVEQFLEQSSLPEPNTIFPFNRNGATWYALVHGVYNSVGSAEAAIENLPASAQLHSPWVRRFEKLQDILITSN